MKKPELVDKVNELQGKLDLQERLYANVVKELRLAGAELESIQDLKTQINRLTSEKTIEATQAKQVLKNMRDERDDFRVKTRRLADVEKSREEYKKMAHEFKEENIKLEKAIIKLSILL